MSDDRPWYREPETFIALAALVVSISAVVVGIYEAALQRAHDRAEVWPHLEIATFTNANGATISIANNGIGPAIVKSAVVTVDGKPRANWPDVIQAYLGHPPTNASIATIVGNGIRAGDRVQMLALPRDDMPADFWKTIGRVGITVCYTSVFNQSWIVTDPRLGSPSSWRATDDCPAQAANVEF